MTGPRLLCIMGSGETAPTMVSVHAELMERSGSPPAPAVLLDTPFGFQENADEIVAKAQAYFRTNVGHPIALATLRSAETADALTLERMLSAVREAAYVFAGPGSPSYALRQWRGTQLAAVLTERLRTGGCITFSSAAATTLGRLTLPVYEVYKVGEAPRWLEGLDLLGPLGIDAAVVPHYDNAEGGTHDTRYCYMGERRLRMLEEMLPSGTGILGVCEHTALVIDLDAGVAGVRGRGAAVLRHAGVEQRIEAGASLPLERLRAGGTAGTRPALQVAIPTPAVVAGHAAAGQGPLLEGVEAHRAAFDAALASGDSDGAVTAVLELDDHLLSWMHDTLDSDEMERGRSVLRGLTVRLGEAARTGLADPRARVAPFVELALRLRREAREQRRYADADAIRDGLVALGVEVRDAPTGTEWVLGDAPAAVR